MRSWLAILTTSFVFAFSGSFAASEQIADDAALFMEKFSGKWRGTGKILIGEDSGLKFHCSLDGDPSRSQMSFGMKGRCWMGRLAAPVFARLRYNEETNRFYGAFMDGSDGNGLDVVGEREGNGFELNLVRGSSRGQLVAEPVGDDEMKVVISLYDRRNDRNVPVVAMGFAKANSARFTSNAPAHTGSIGSNR